MEHIAYGMVTIWWTRTLTAVRWAMGYINEGWEDANASFQPNPRNPYEILIVFKRTLQAHGIYELTVCYEPEYWERLHERLGILAYLKWQQFYSNSRSRNRNRRRQQP